MHRCPECEAACICGGDIAEAMSELPNQDCIHCAPTCDHGVSFDVPCTQCDALIHASEDEIDTADDASTASIHSCNGGW